MLLTAAIFAFLAVPVGAYYTLQQEVPNGGSVPCWDGAVDCSASCGGLGHTSCGGGGPRNPFGLALKEAGFKWTLALCLADTDEDGYTNGYELGDPCCVWTKGETPQMSGDFTPTHPGFAGSVPTEQYRDRLPECSVEVIRDETTASLGGFNDGEERRELALTIRNFTLPREETTYVDFRFNFDDDTHDIFHIVLGTAIVSLPQNLHHFVVTGCSEKVPENQVGVRTGENDCWLPLGGFAGWAPGSVLWDVPRNVGVPIGRGVGIVGFNIEVHFTDADRVSRQLVSSDGIRVYYTPDLRPNQILSLNILELGFEARINVPPQTERFFLTRSCTVMDVVVDGACFNYHADITNVAALMGQGDARSCYDVLDWCTNNTLMALMYKYCRKACNMCAEDEGHTATLDGYRFIADGYCCTEGVPVSYAMEEAPHLDTVEDCAALCTSEGDCVGFVYVSSTWECHRVTELPTEAPVVSQEGLKFYVKDDVTLNKAWEGGSCDEASWQPSLGSVSPCGECTVLLQDEVSCSSTCQKIGRQCASARLSEDGCVAGHHESTTCDDDAPNILCECSVNITHYVEPPNRDPLGQRPAVSSFFHAHLLGREMYQHKRRPTLNDTTRPRLENMASQPRWNFNFQATYPIDSTLQSGDVITATCVFNSMERDQPTSIGLSTYQEMCFVLSNVVYPSDMNVLDRHLSCVGGQIWTGELAPEEDAKDILANHPWHEGDDIFGTAGWRGEAEEQGQCNTYFDSFKMRCISTLSTWDDLQCEGQVDMETSRAERCLQSFTDYQSCMRGAGCTWGEQWKMEYDSFWKEHIAGLGGPCTQIPRRLAEKFQAQSCEA